MIRWRIRTYQEMYHLEGLSIREIRVKLPATIRDTISKIPEIRGYRPSLNKLS